MARMQLLLVWVAFLALTVWGLPLQPDGREGAKLTGATAIVTGSFNQLDNGSPIRDASQIISFQEGFRFEHPEGPWAEQEIDNDKRRSRLRTLASGQDPNGRYPPPAKPTALVNRPHEEDAGKN
ncbi:hypothetical protein V8F20_005370 [Naviculisporaceae sp. PSN 640]